jgi:Ca-activated chloride channel family protein
VQAASDFINRVLVGNNDRIFVEQISTVPTATQLMSKAELLAYKFDLRPAGGTALYDGLALACNDRMQKDNVEPSLRAIVVLSDGGDNMSRIDSKQSITSAQRAGVVAFGVSTEDDDNLSGRGSQGNAFLKQLAEGTGGIAFLHLKRKDMARVFEKIQEQVGNMHLISYIPPDANLNSPYHPIELKSASGTKMKLRAPKGYYLTAKAQ